ncbi:glycoside hydrolase [Paenibacillus sp. CC-CFT747]|nr:glycoside hydrolase [Paenibacillus sp. CC-CFT747]
MLIQFTAKLRKAGKILLVSLTACAGFSFSSLAEANSFGPSGLDGSGWQSVVVVDPANANLLIDGADVSGIHKTTDKGVNWTPSNNGFTEKNQIQIASLAWSQTDGSKVYAATGRFGQNGGLYVSIDKGDSWTRLSSIPQFAGGNTDPADSLYSPHPRSTGNLIALDEANGYLYVATYKQGVMRYTISTNTWATIGLVGKYLRTLAIDPNDKNTLYTSASKDGVYKTTTARTSANVTSGNGSFSKLTNGPADIEEMKFIGSNLYAVGQDGANGKVYKVTSGGSTWTSLLTTPWSGSDQTTYMSVDGVAGTNDTIYVGAWQGQKNTSGQRESVLKSIDSGATWTSISTTPPDASITRWADRRATLGTCPPSPPLDDERQHVRRRLHHRQSVQQRRDLRIRTIRRMEGHQGGGRQIRLVPACAQYERDLQPVDRRGQEQRGSCLLARDRLGIPVLQRSDGPRERECDRSRHEGWERNFPRLFDLPGTVYLSQSDANKIFSNPDPAAGTAWTDEGIDTAAGSLAGYVAGVAVKNYNKRTAGDSFIRTAVSSWGTAEAGGAWTNAGGAATDFSVSGGVGKILLNSTANRYSRLNSSTAIQDTAGLVSLSWDGVPTAGDVFGAPFTRMSNGIKDYYSFRLRNDSTGAVMIQAQKTVNNVTVSLGTELSVAASYTAGAKYWMRYEVKGTNPVVLNVRVWKDGTEEPTTWTYTYSDSAADRIAIAGKNGLRAGANGSYANSITYSFDNYGVDEIASGGKIVLGAIQNGGLWKKSGTSWSKVISETAALYDQQTNSAVFSWPSGSNTVYMFDRETGVWRSNDNGGTWTHIWTINSETDMTGYVAADPTSPGTLYVSYLDNLYRLDNADTMSVDGGTLTPVQLTATPLLAGPITTDANGVLYVTSRSAGTTQARIYRSTDKGSTLTDISDAYYRANVGFPYKIDIGPDGYIYISMNGTGIQVGQP